MERPIRISAKALILKADKLLALRLEDGDGAFYILPGGGVEDGEALPEAVAREVQEETGLRVCPGELAFVIEGPEGEPFHRIDLVFLCKYLGESDTAPRPDRNQTGAVWLDTETLPDAPLYPSRLRAPIRWLAQGRETARYLGSESVGDPPVRADCPCTDSRCPRHGDCAACLRHHAGHAKSRFTACGKCANKEKLISK